MPVYSPCEFKVMRVRGCGTDAQRIETPEQAAEYWRANIPKADWFDPAKECSVVLVLNIRRRVIGHNLVSLGDVGACLITPGSVFRPAIVAAGCAIILMHNHPSGDQTPSEQDIRITRQLAQAAQLLKIDLVDHVVMGNDFFSLRNHGYFVVPTPNEPR